MKTQAAASIFFLATSLPSALGWGTLGHQTVAYIATNFVSSATKTKFQSILGDTSANYLATVSTWADTYRYTDAGTWSAPLHFIDANDDPPSSCGVEYSRDCGSEGCVVSAIKNYTSRVQSSSLSDADVATAAKFLVHFIGDIHQPLHDEGLDLGGNEIDVTFDGESTNLHHIVSATSSLFPEKNQEPPSNPQKSWDTNIPEKYVGGYALSDAKSFAATLTTSIKTGSYESEKASWLDGIDLSDPVTSATSWASDANSYVCSTVMPNGISAVEKTDLSGAYYTKAIPIVELQIAKAGYRLAAWLDLIATGSTGL
ncbi:Nuclease S1 [Lachnellula subtilissima]|uniref:Nuclease S1 n=1 Tax=Lachnellula subtilissima TaxID=602034 RepID=A0A8H8RRX8_9HELO|nr:Nuclease S1 [Lachnellula subtilissima]